MNDQQYQPIQPETPQQQNNELPNQAQISQNSQTTSTTNTKKIIVYVAVSIAAILAIVVVSLLIFGMMWVSSAANYSSKTDEIIANDKSAIESVKAYPARNPQVRQIGSLETSL